MSYINCKRYKKWSNNGQVFMEFILLLAVLVVLSYGLLRGINGGISERWRAIVGIVSSPNPENPSIPEIR